MSKLQKLGHINTFHIAEIRGISNELYKTIGVLYKQRLNSEKL